MTGQEFFSQIKVNSEKVKLLRQVSALEQIAWESQPVSAYSPSVVSDSEDVIRSILDPIHTDGDELKPTAFDDMFTHGLSVNRDSLSDISSIINAQLARISLFNEKRAEGKPPRSYVGYVRFAVSLLRSLLHENRRQIAVYDTAIAEDISHAEICELIGGELAKRSARANIYRLAKEQFTIMNA